MSFFYGKVQELDWDPERIEWPVGVYFLLFISKLGRKLRLSRHIIPPIVPRKWVGTLDEFYKV